VEAPKERIVMRKQLNPSLAISCLALFISLGGGAYAISISGKNIKNGSITGADIKNKSLTASDFRPGTLPAYRFSLIPKTIQVGQSTSVGAEKGFSFTLACTREQGDSWDGNGLEVVIKLLGKGATGTKQLADMPAYPTNEVNRQNNLAPQRTRITFSSGDFKVLGEETDAQGEANMTVDADAGTCALTDGIVKVR
jgi:hypothetical protein